MRTHTICLALAIVLVCPFASAQSRLPNLDNQALYTDIPAGPVSGIWTRAGSPYHITGEITVPNDSTLLIEPGVEVVFMGHYKLNVQGRLLAVGTQQDTIRFRAADIQAGWHGIRFDGTASTNDTSKIVYSVLRNGKANTGSGFDRCGGAIMIREFDKVLVSRCLLDSNLQSGQEMTPVPTAGPAVYVYEASPTIAHSTFSHNAGSKGSAIACVYSPKAIISNNTLFENVGGWVAPIVTYGIGSPVISGNLIFDNVAGEGAGGISIEFGASSIVENNIVIRNRAPGAAGIMCYTSACPVLLNNTIAFNIATSEGGGIGCYFDSDPILINNIIYGNTAPVGHQVMINDNYSDPVFVYCDIQGGKEGFGGSGAGAFYTGFYENNIDSDPMFVSVTWDNYRLQDSSQCIGAGIDSVQIAGLGYHAPSTCFHGSPRPNPAGSQPDIGACENPRRNPLTGIEDIVLRLPAAFALEQNYPNPFNPSTTIAYLIPGSRESGVRSMETKLVVYDILGREVAVLVNGRKAPGSYEVKFDGAGLSGGVYFYRLSVSPTARRDLVPTNGRDGQAGDFVQTRKLLLLK